MSLPTKSNIQTLDYGFMGQSFCDVLAKDSIDIKTMDYAFNGQPFVCNYSTYIPQIIIIS